jgi:para-nitrobenzyl esterase
LSTWPPLFYFILSPGRKDKIETPRTVVLLQLSSRQLLVSEAWPQYNLAYPIPKQSHKSAGEPNMMHAMTPFLGVVILLGQTGESSKQQAANKATARIPTAEIRIDSGPIRGLTIGDKKDVQAYEGIPYAAPPVGERRWKAPEPVSNWQAVRDCFEFGAACPQKTPPLFASIPEMAINAPLSEDCLFLNVWTPVERKSEKLPVLYWIHGGGFVMGAASQPLYDGEELARLGCVVISVNYRLGLFGFLAHPELSKESKDHVSGNYGLLDQIEGLRWVQRNIAMFGGDPGRVTIFGVSAGAMSVLSLMVAPQAKGLFQGAIVQSAAGMNLARLREERSGQESAEQAGRRYIAACGLPEPADARQMRQLDTKTILQSSPGEPSPGGPLQLKPLTLKLGPIVDGAVIPDNPDRLFAARREHQVPMIIGNTKDEMAVFLLTTKMPADEAAYKAKLKEDFGDLGDAFAVAYPASNTKEIRAGAIQLTSDLSFVSETRRIARAHSAAGQTTFRYQFSRGTKKGFLQALGAHHGAELAYLFQRPSSPNDPAQMPTSRTLGHYWINFAATGDPNGQGLPSWPAYRPGEEETLDFAETVALLKGPRNEQLDIVEKFLQTMANGGELNTGK